MKKNLLLLIAILALLNIVKAQAPNAIPYQGVARNAAGNILAAQPISLRVSIHDISASGTVVFSETHAATTNTLGLFNVNIGSGTAVTGTLAGVNWGSGAKYIQVEMDATGGTSYADMGTTQLNSVPYALYSGNANSGNFVDLTTAQTVAGAKTFSSAIKITAGSPGAGKVLTSDAAGLASWSTPANSTLVHYIGESYGGGIVFYLYDNGQHGLIAATADQSNYGIQWYNGIYRTTGTTGDGLNAGAMNTAMIVATQMADNQIGIFAAKVCADYSVTVGGIIYGDWYLPSMHELNLLYLQNNVFGGWTNFANFYWSSTEDGNGYGSAWGQNFANGYQFNVDKSSAFYVRAVRAF